MQKGRMKGLSQRGHRLSNGMFGVKALDSVFVTSRQIEAARIAATRYMKREGQLWIKIFPDKPITKKPLEVRMGKGKGALDHYVAVVKPGRILFEISGVPIVIPIVLFIIFAGTFLLDRTKFGRHLYAVGGNPEAARRAGIKVVRIRITAFVITSSLAVVAGLFHVSRIGVVEAASGRTIVLSGVAAAVVGGVSLFGGRGRLVHAALGALVISIIDNGLGLLGFSAGISFVVTGTVLALAATVDAVSRRRGGSVRRI